MADNENPSTQPVAPADATPGDAAVDAVAQQSAQQSAQPLTDPLSDPLTDVVEDDDTDDLGADLLEEQPVKNTADLDEISLAQALLDVDIANARVIDLTKRLTTMSKELRQTTSELQKARLRNRKLAVELEELDELKSSRAFRSATAAQRVLGAARARLGR
jgi:hypothetical protein